MTEYSNAMKRRVLKALIEQNDRGLLPTPEELAMVTGLDAKMVAGCVRWLEDQGYVNRPAQPRGGTA